MTTRAAVKLAIRRTVWRRRRYARTPIISATGADCRPFDLPEEKRFLRSKPPDRDGYRKR